MRRVLCGVVSIAMAIVTALAGYAVADAKHAGATTALGPGLVTVTVTRPGPSAALASACFASATA